MERTEFQQRMAKLAPMRAAVVAAWASVRPVVVRWIDPDGTLGAAMAYQGVLPNEPLITVEWWATGQVVP